LPSYAKIVLFDDDGRQSPSARALGNGVCRALPLIAHVVFSDRPDETFGKNPKLVYKKAWKQNTSPLKSY
jgi:hypothetical protein